MFRKIALSLLVHVLLILVILFFSQRNFFYLPSQIKLAEPPNGYGFVETLTSDKLRLRAAYHAAKKGRPTLLFFHGNGDSIAGADAATRDLVEQGYGALLVEYRGYGGNPGAPTEEGLYRDGEAAIEWLSGQSIRTKNVVIVGNSIGSGPATELALRHDPAGLILISGFASLPIAASDRWPFIPAHFLVRDRYDNQAKLGRVKSPILIMHGDEDTLVRPTHAKLLAKPAPNAELVMVAGAGHELAYSPEAQQIELNWLSKLRP